MSARKLADTEVRQRHSSYRSETSSNGEAQLDIDAGASNPSVALPPTAINNIQTVSGQDILKM